MANGNQQTAVAKAKAKKAELLKELKEMKTLRGVRAKEIVYELLK